MVQFDLLAEDRHTRLVIRRGDIRDQSPLESGPKSCLQCLDVFGRLIAGDDDLLAGRMKMVERMEEFLLRTLLTNDKLDIIDKKHVIVTVFVTELSHSRFVLGSLAVLQRFDQFIGECLARNIKHFLLRVLIQYKMCDRMHQMRLPQSDVSVQE